MGWKKLVMLLVNIIFVKQNINQVLFILFTKLVNCTFAQSDSQTVGQSDNQTVRQPECRRTVRHSDSQTVRQSNSQHRTVLRCCASCSPGPPPSPLSPPAAAFLTRSGRAGRRVCLEIFCKRSPS